MLGSLIKMTIIPQNLIEDLFMKENQLNYCVNKERGFGYIAQMKPY